MKTTVHIEDDLFLEIKNQAASQGSSFKSLLNRTLRNGLQNKQKAKKKSYRSPSYAMGEPDFGNIPLDKALALASNLEDTEILDKLEKRK